MFVDRHRVLLPLELTAFVVQVVLKRWLDMAAVAAADAQYVPCTTPKDTVVADTGENLPLRMSALQVVAGCAVKCGRDRRVQVNASPETAHATEEAARIAMEAGASRAGDRALFRLLLQLPDSARRDVKSRVQDTGLPVDGCTPMLRRLEKNFVEAVDGDCPRVAVPCRLKGRSNAGLRLQRRSHRKRVIISGKSSERSARMHGSDMYV